MKELKFISQEELSYSKIFLPDLCRKMTYVLNKHQDQFRIARKRDDVCLFDVTIVNMVKMAISKGYEDDPDTIALISTISFQPNPKDIEKQHRIRIITYIPIPIGLSSLTRLLDMMLGKYDLASYIDHQIDIHGINYTEKTGFTYNIHLKIDQEAFDKFIDMLSEYYSDVK
jgi:hypothetical protein